LESGFRHEKVANVMRVLVIDLGECVDCDACIEMCPRVFRRNDLGSIEVVMLPGYPEEEIEEAIKNCPTDCIAWE
jgi:ferredoxin